MKLLICFITIVAVIMAWQIISAGDEKTIVVVENNPDPKYGTNHEKNKQNLPPGGICVEANGLADAAAKILGALGDGDCIKSLHFRGHGAPGYQGVGDGEKYEADSHINGNNPQWKDKLKGLKGKFCDGAKISLWGCGVGSCNKGAEKLQELADFFGVPVEGATDKVKAGKQNDYDGGKQTATPGDSTPACKEGEADKAKKKDTADVCVVALDAMAFATYVNVTWATMDELITTGFNVYRALDGREPLERCNRGIIPARGGEADVEVPYEYVDRDVERGFTYFYWLEEIDEFGRSAMNGPVSVTVGPPEPEEVPIPLNMEQNYPNPFNPVTEISYELPAAGHVRIDVYDVRGRKVVTLVDEYQEPGRKTVSWNGLDAAGTAVSSGVYFCRLQAGKSIVVKKMTLLR
jgi:hypothetical protein